MPSALISSSCLASGEICTKGEDFDCCSCSCLPSPADQDLYFCGSYPLCTVNLDPPHVDKEAVVEEYQTKQDTDGLEREEQSIAPASDFSGTTDVVDTSNTCIPESGYCDPSNPNHCCSCQCFWSLFYVSRPCGHPSHQASVIPRQVD